MADLITDEPTWNRWKGKMPVIYDAAAPPGGRGAVPPGEPDRGRALGGRVGGWCALLALLGSGCLIPNRYPSAGEPLALADGTALVFGRVQVLEDGVDVTRDFCDPWAFPAATATLLDFLLLDLDRRSVALHIIPERDGAFYWVLPRGLYRIRLVRYREEFDPQLAFRVPEGDRCVYVGRLVIRAARPAVPYVSLRRHAAGVRRQLAGVETSVEDDFERDREALVGRFPGVPGPIGKSLLFPSDRE